MGPDVEDQVGELQGKVSDMEKALGAVNTKLTSLFDFQKSMMKEFHVVFDRNRNPTQNETLIAAGTTNGAVSPDPRLQMKEPHSGKEKGKEQATSKAKSYKQWSSEESNELLSLMVDAVNRRWCDSSGALGKSVVVHKILPALNGKLGSQKDYSHYQSRLKWFKKRYTRFVALMGHSSEFGWDPVTKKFTASDEVWENYFKSYPTQRYLRAGTFTDYDDLRIAVGKGIATGKRSLAISSDYTDATTYGPDERVHVKLEDGVNEVSNTLIASENESSSQVMPLDLSTEPLPSQDMNKEDPPESTGEKKRKRTEYESNVSSDETTTPDVLGKLCGRLDIISSSFTAIRSLMEKTESKETRCWDAIKEIPNFDNRVRFQALELLNTKAKKDMFLTLSLDERREWIRYKTMTK